MNFHELVAEYQEQADYLQKRICEYKKKSEFGDEEFAMLRHYEGMYDDVIYSIKMMSKYV